MFTAPAAKNNETEEEDSGEGHEGGRYAPVSLPLLFFYFFIWSGQECHTGFADKQTK